MPKSAIKYVAEIANVGEVSLLAAADFEYWRDALRGEELTPVARNGRAQVMLSATDAKFRGLRFRELSASVFVRESESGIEGWFMAHAYNSIRFFAWVERTWFSTPYYHGRIEAKSKSPAMMAVQDGDASFHAAMALAGAASRESVRTGVESWQGPIFLPTRPGASRKFFYAKLSGQAQAFPFLEGRDHLVVTPAPRWPIFSQLRDSNLTGVEWLVRPNAAHAKSRTYDRPAAAMPQ